MKAAPSEHRGDEVGDAEAAGAEGQLGHRVEQDRVEEDLAAGLGLAADDRQHRDARPCAYSSFISSESAQKWGGVQKKTIAKR